MVLYGAATGRDGIGGVSVLASAPSRTAPRPSRPSVQIGDPFAEKLLIEASLELIGKGLLEGLQDLGGAGICCAVSESAARAGMGAEVDLDAVPLRDDDMEPFEILTRIAGTDARDRAPLEAGRGTTSLRAPWGLHTAVIGTLVEGDALHIRHRGETVAAVSARSLADDGPEYDRPRSTSPASRPVDPALTPSTAI